MAYGSLGAPTVTPGVYCPVGVNAKVGEWVGREVAVYTGLGSRLGEGLTVGFIVGVGVAVIVGSVGDGFVLVTVGPGGGGPGGVGVLVADRGVIVQVGVFHGTSVGN